jgi:hypothetical protein
VAGEFSPTVPGRTCIKFYCRLTHILSWGEMKLDGMILVTTNNASLLILFGGDDTKIFRVGLT